MACLITLKYPTAASPTITFAPVRGALVAETKFHFRTNAIVHEMTDPRIQYTYVKGGPFRERSHTLLCSAAELDTFYTFWTAALGKSFELQDPFTGAGYVLQRFPKDASEPEPTLNSGGGTAELIWRLPLTFRDALS
jgi:hypothetical protein